MGSDRIPWPGCGTFTESTSDIGEERKSTSFWTGGSTGCEILLRKGCRTGIHMWLESKLRKSDCESYTAGKYGMSVAEAKNIQDQRSHMAICVLRGNHLVEALFPF